VQTDAANSKFLASTSTPPLGSSAPVEQASTAAPSPVVLEQTAAQAIATNGTEQVVMCKPSCRVENFPGPLELAQASMCELDYCEGCPQCAKLTARTSSRGPAPASNNSTATTLQKQTEANTTDTSKEDKSCRSSCREENFPGTPELQLASMCEWDHCMGCPKCASLKQTLASTTLGRSVPVQEQKTTTLPVNESTSFEHANYSTTPAASSEAVARTNAFASVLVGTLAVLALH